MNSSKLHTDPYWAKLLRSWHAFGRTGLSLPFLLGAGSITRDDSAPTAEDAKILLAEIFEKGIPGTTIRISWCSMMKTYAIGIISEDTNDGIFLATPATIYAIDLVCQEFGSLPQEIITGLSELYADEIACHLFSDQWPMAPLH